MGRVCVYAKDPMMLPIEQSFTDGVIVHIAYETSPCVSPDCTLDMTAQCQVFATGMTIDVRATASWTDTTNQLTAGSYCNLACWKERAVCTTPALATGSFTIHFGESSIPLDVPSQLSEPPCIESLGQFRLGTAE